jgi:hypothetical protein
MRVLLTVLVLLGVTSSALAQQDAEVRLTTSAEATAVKKPETTGTATVRLKPDTTSRSTVRLKPDTTGTIAGSAGCWPMTTRDRVVVHVDDGPALKGTLLCMGPEEIMLTGSGTLPLSRIREIEKPRDPAFDGMLKGAAVGLVILLFCLDDCEAEYVLRATMGYAALGAAIDAIQGNNKTIYRREPRAGVAWRIRF